MANTPRDCKELHRRGSKVLLQLLHSHSWSYVYLKNELHVHAIAFLPFRYLPCVIRSPTFLSPVVVVNHVDEVDGCTLQGNQVILAGKSMGRKKCIEGIFMGENLKFPG